MEGRRMPSSSVQAPYGFEAVMTGEQYRESLNVGAECYDRGERIDDLTYPHTAPVIEWHSTLYEAQHAPETKDLLTAEQGGRRVSTTWLMPRTPEDLDLKRRATEWMTWQTLATM